MSDIGKIQDVEIIDEMQRYYFRAKREKKVLSASSGPYLKHE